MSGIGSDAETVEPSWVGEVIRFWFGELTAAQWFAKSDDLDTRIRERFGSLHERLVANDAADAQAPRSMLAAVIVFDQFSRNLFRSDPRAYAADPVARRLARSAIGLGFDLSMSGPERMFLYMPFQHSEDAADQQLSVELFARLGDKDWSHYAVAHKAIIDRFGRFPHRNAVLSRPSTAEEIDFLRDPAKSF